VDGLALLWYAGLELPLYVKGATTWIPPHPLSRLSLPNYPPYQPLPRRSNASIIVLSIVLAVVLCAACTGGTFLALASGAIPSPLGSWTTVAIYDNSNVTEVAASTVGTPVFSVSNNWRFQWSCLSNDPNHILESFSVDVLDENGHSVHHGAVDRNCTSETNWLSGTVYEGQGGRFSFLIDIHTMYTKFKITVQSR